MEQESGQGVALPAAGINDQAPFVAVWQKRFETGRRPIMLRPIIVCQRVWQHLSTDSCGTDDEGSVVNGRP